jgi:hypothetical protein
MQFQPHNSAEKNVGCLFLVFWVTLGHRNALDDAVASRLIGKQAVEVPNNVEICVPASFST